MIHIKMSKTELLYINNVQYHQDTTDNGSSASKPKIIRPNEFTTLENRLRTYVDWPNTKIDSEKLALAGFIYTDKDDIVLCPFCKVEGYRWETEDNPMEDHRNWSPHCPFIRSNVDSGAELSEATLDTCGLYGIEVVPNSVPEEKKYDLKRLGVHKNVIAQYPDKALLEIRLETFEKWPKAIKQRPKELAEAGFFYTGVGDQTLCFHCGGGLKDWEENDDPWEQHALWFSKCSYLNLKKGPEFVKKIKEKHQESPSPSAPVEDPSETATKEPEISEKKSEKEVLEQTLCKICYKNELGVVFLPCGHIVACVDCAAALKNCAVCRKPLEASVRAFLS